MRRLVEELPRPGAAAPATAAPEPAAPRARRATTRHDAAAPPRRATAAHDLPLTASSTGHIVMLVGPTGAGKTTTIAKLATRAALVDGRRVGLITLDNYRVGGIDQIRTFADLIGVPLQVAETPAALAGLIDPEHDLTLIDTAGRSPRDRAAIEELALHLEGLDIEVHLVVPAGATGPQVDELAERYSPLGPVRLLFTKLDECDHAPELALAPARTRLPITWVTTGQAVPEDIEQPTSARVLELASSGLGDASTPRNRSQRAA
jgi:flagellar biosynthesis protein FlhF